MKTRFFFPPPPVEPKIEYLQGYFSDYDLASEKQSFLTKYLLGEGQPRAIFTSPMDVASDGKGRVYVADSGSRQVVVLDLVNHSYHSLSMQNAKSGMERRFAVPIAVTVAADGKVYVTDVFTKSVEVFDEAERYLFSISAPDLLRPVAVAVDLQRGVIYVVDAANHRLARFDLQGKLIDYFGERGDAAGEFNYPTDVDVDDQGHVYVLDALNSRVQVFDETGEFLRMFGERGTTDSSFSMAKNLAVSSSGQVYVTDALAHKLVIFSSTGEFLLRIGKKSVVRKGISPGGFYLPRGVDIDSAGGLWVVDTLNRMVHNFQFLTPQYLLEHPLTEGVPQQP